MTLGIAPKRAKPRWLSALVAVTVISLLASAIALAGAIGTASGFEDDDGNLNPQAPINFDWNSFDPTTWTGTAPSRVTEKTVSGWKFLGLEDWAATTADSGFAGGTKQDANCPSVITAKAPNKDDLKRVYVSSKTVDGHVYLNLAWVRIPQNTTSASAHIGFEFNKGTTACAGPGGLVNRTAGDMLIVYDFEGSSTDNPTLTVRRWVTSGACEISSNSAPCWGIASDLTAAGFAEAKVNTLASATDTIAPVDETLGLNEFGEAGIDLTAAGIFSSTTCDGFGKVYAVSRSSGNSGTAQMKDLVGPGNFSLNNCGTVTVIKQTNPRGINQNFSFTSNLAGTQMVCTADTTPAAFTLNDTGNAGKTLGSSAPAQNSAGNTETCTNVPAGSYTVTEGADPAGFAFGSLTCTSSGAGTSVTTSGKVATITMAGGGAVTCVYVNNQQLGAIEITKTRKHAADGPGSHPHAGVTFTVNGQNVVTDADGKACVDGLAFGAYNVVETVPTGYVADGATTKEVTVDNNADCDDDPYVGETVSFGNTPLSDITISINSQVNGGTASTVTCVDENGDPFPALALTTGANGDGSDSATNLPPIVLDCHIVIDP